MTRFKTIPERFLYEFIVNRSDENAVEDRNSRELSIVRYCQTLEPQCQLLFLLPRPPAGEHSFPFIGVVTHDICGTPSMSASPSSAAPSSVTTTARPTRVSGSGAFSMRGGRHVGSRSSRIGASSNLVAVAQKTTEKSIVAETLATVSTTPAAAPVMTIPVPAAAATPPNGVPAVAIAPVIELGSVLLSPSSPSSSVQTSSGDDTVVETNTQTVVQQAGIVPTTEIISTALAMPSSSLGSSLAPIPSSPASVATSSTLASTTPKPITSSFTVRCQRLPIGDFYSNGALQPDLCIRIPPSDGGFLNVDRNIGFIEQCDIIIQMLLRCIWPNLQHHFIIQMDAKSKSIIVECKHLQYDHQQIPIYESGQWVPDFLHIANILRTLIQKMYWASVESKTDPRRLAQSTAIHCGWRVQARARRA
jgi:hypothetical protein